MTGATRRLSPPSGHPPPRRVEFPGGSTVDLEILAIEICRRYRAIYADEQDRYGEAGVAWCVHDNQHLLNWAVVEARGFGSMEADVRWLAGILDARGFPLDRLAHDLDIAADVVEHDGPEDAGAVVAALRASAARVRDMLTRAGG